MKPISAFSVLFAVVISVLCTGQSLAQGINPSFVRIADTTNTINPGTGTNFTSFGAIANDNGNVSFNGISNTYQGIIEDQGGTLNVLVDTNTAVPNGVGNYTSFGGLWSDNGEHAISGIDASTTDIGIYRLSGGLLSTVANYSTTIPGSSNTFGWLTSPTISSGNIGRIANYCGRQYDDHPRHF